MSDERPKAGKVIWHDLMTTDPKASLAFYTELLGWRTKETDMGAMGMYTMFFAGEKGVGGMVPLDTSHGIPSHWIAYITVDDVDAAAARIPELGGKVGVPPTDIPDVGRFAVAVDGQGAVTSPMQDKNPAPEESGWPAVGTFCWEELMTQDPAAAVKFYSALYGWTTREQDMGPMGKYTLCYRGDQQVGGIMKHPHGEASASYWLSYVVVDDVDASTARAEKLGGKILVPPMDIPNVGRFSTVADPSGAAIALFKGSPKLQ
jgi:hypothetical protein